MELNISNESLPVYKALASEIRLAILHEISLHPITAIELSKKLHLSPPAISKNLKILVEAHLINFEAGPNNHRKKYIPLVQDINIHLPEVIYPEYRTIKQQIPIGNFFNLRDIQPSCGLIGKNSVIQHFDDPSTFISPDRIKAELLYFTSGEIEYKLPINNKIDKNLKMIVISFEAASEFPGSNNNWPSKIGISINKFDVGSFTLKGNPSDVRGRYTPDWWDDHFSQYGQLVQIRINDQDTGINGVKISDISLKDLQYDSTNSLSLKLKVLNQFNRSPHGLTLFGKHFGNYRQDILLTTYWS